MALTSQGIGSGMDVAGLVQKLVAAEQTPATSRLDRNEASVQAKVSALGTFKGALSAFQSSMSGLKNLSSFQKINATSSDSSTISASAASNADVGNYRLDVKQLAQTHGLASAAIPDPGSTLGTGTLTIKFGTTSYDPVTGDRNGFSQNGEKGTLTLTVDSSNNTLTGLRDAINKANAGVTAAVLNDGSGYRLVLNSSDSGAKNSMQVSVSDPSLSAFAFDGTAGGMTQTQTAQDARVAINGLDVYSPSNTLTTTLKGLTLNLLQAQPGKPITLKVEKDNGNVSQAVDAFVKGFNDLAKTVKDLGGYNAKTGTAGVLIGESSLRSAFGTLRAELGGIVAGLESSAFRSLGDIGLSTQADGTLKLDSTKLTNALNSNSNAVAALFTVIGLPDDSGVNYNGSTADTKAGNYAVYIKQAATQAMLKGSLISSTTVDGTNDTFKITVDGVQSGDIKLTQQAYTSKSALAAEIQSRINGDSALKAAGVAANLTYDSVSDSFVFTSKRFGAASAVTLSGLGAVANSLGLKDGSATGIDVDGTIDGSAATGAGQTLTATSGGAKGLGLNIQDNKIGIRGSVVFSRGLMESLNNTLNGFLDSKGILASRTDGLDRSLKDIGNQRTKLAIRMNALQIRLTKQFNAMDAMLGSLQATGSALTQQFAAMNNNNSNK